MVINRFRRYRIQVPLNIWAEIPFNLTHVRYLQFKQWGELNQKPSPISRLFPHLEAIQNHTKYQKNWLVVFILPHCPLYFVVWIHFLTDESPWNPRLLQDVFAVGVKAGVPHLSAASMLKQQELTLWKLSWPPSSAIKTWHPWKSPYFLWGF